MKFTFVVRLCECAGGRACPYACYARALRPAFAAAATRRGVTNGCLHAFFAAAKTLIENRVNPFIDKVASYTLNILTRAISA